MKIVNIVDEFFPEAGYENNVLSKYFVKFGHEYTILTTDLKDSSNFFSSDNIEQKDKAFTEATGVKVRRLHAKARISGRAVWDYDDFQAELKKLAPDIAFFCGNDTLIAMQYVLHQKKLDRCVIMDSHMLEMASENKFRKIYRMLYKIMITPIILRNKIIVIRQQNDKYVEKCLGIPLYQAPWISFGADTLLFYPDKAVKAVFRKEHHIDEKDFVIVCTGKLNEGKGGLFLANAFKKRFETNKRVILIVVGNAFGEYGKKVEEAFLQSENTILRFPTQEYKNLAKFYQAGDLSVFAKQCSLSFYDAQACGLPVLSENNNVNIDRCSHNNGWTFESGSEQDLRAKINYIVNMPEDKFSRFSDNAAKFISENYDYECKAREFEKIFLNELDKFKMKK